MYTYTLLTHSQANKQATNFDFAAIQGTITMDGVNLLSLGLNEVRGRIAAIPQDPVLFSGSVRSNLDPFDRYADADLWEALRLVNLHVRS